MKGLEVINKLKEKFEVQRNEDLARKVGVTVATINNWIKYQEVTPRQVVGLVANACAAAQNEFALHAICPLVEFYPIDKKLSASNKHMLFDASESDAASRKYRAGLKDALASHYGVYVFYDSRGHAIYVGKAKSQRLGFEMTSVFNRDRGKLQKIRRVDRPSKNNVSFTLVGERQRQIKELPVRLHDLAAYFSAYSVERSMIDELEAMLVRSFANDLLNKRMERFGTTRKSREK